MSKAFKVITTIIIIASAFFTVLMTFIGLTEIFSDTGYYVHDEDSFIYYLQDGQYGDMVRYYHQNVAADAPTTETLEECYAIAKYYEASIDYQLAKQDNDSERLEESKERMDAAAKEMGELAFEKEKIDALWN